MSCTSGSVIIPKYLMMRSVPPLCCSGFRKMLRPWLRGKRLGGALGASFAMQRSLGTCTAKRYPDMERGEPYHHSRQVWATFALRTKLFLRVCELLFEPADFCFCQPCVYNYALRISRVMLLRRCRLLCCCLSSLSFISSLLVYWDNLLFSCLYFLISINIVEFRRIDFKTFMLNLFMLTFILDAG